MEKNKIILFYFIIIFILENKIFANFKNIIIILKNQTVIIISYFLMDN